jgi:hypothetical protein
MKPALIKTTLASTLLLLFVLPSSAQQQGSDPVQGNAGQASQPVGNSAGPGTVTQPAPATTGHAASSPAAGTAASVSDSNADDNPYDPLLEPPPLPKGKPTLIGGIATSVDHVRNRLTIQPFGRGTKIKLFVDERSHIYRDGAETTVLSIQKGDRIYADTMLDGSRVFAKNIRVATQTGVAEVRGKLIAVDPEKGILSVQDQLSAKPVTFAIGGNTKYSSAKGSATSGDVGPGSLVDVQFSPRRDNRAVADEIIVLAKPGDNYIFSGVVTSLDMRSNTLAVENHSDDQTYEIHFTSAALSDPRALKIGSEVTARAVFDGKQYKASNVRIEDAKPEDAAQTEVR